jgi:hypothetical protein
VVSLKKYPTHALAFLGHSLGTDYNLVTQVSLRLVPRRVTRPRRMQYCLKRKYIRLRTRSVSSSNYRGREVRIVRHRRPRKISKRVTLRFCERQFWVPFICKYAQVREFTCPRPLKIVPCECNRGGVLWKHKKPFQRASCTHATLRSVQIR